MNAIAKMFEFEGKVVETIWDEENNRALFKANHICDVLEYSNPHKALADHVLDKDLTKRYPLTAGGKQQTNYLTLPGVLTLIGRSNMPKAVEFQHFVNGTILPDIMTKGFYVAPDSQVNFGDVLIVSQIIYEVVIVRRLT